MISSNGPSGTPKIRDEFRILFFSILHLAKYKKLSAQERSIFQRFVLFYLEYCQLLQRPPYQQAVVIVDATGAGFAQLDMDIGSFMVDLIYSYYPDAVAIGELR